MSNPATFQLAGDANALAVKFGALLIRSIARESATGQNRSEGSSTHGAGQTAGGADGRRADGRAF